MHHILIGAGPAGVVAAETLRKLDPRCQITLIGDESEPPYSRMAIPYVLVENIDERGTYLRKGDGHYESQRIELLRDRVTGVQPADRSIKLEKGGVLAYDKLLVATGSRPSPPPIPGVDSPDVHGCWTLEDARLIMAKATPGAKVVLMGAGFIGCIILQALASRGVDLTVVEMADRMVPRMMNTTTGNLIKTWCEVKDVKVHTATRVTAIQAGNGAHPLALELDNGSPVEADLVIAATGIHANTEFLQGSGIRTDVGILVNEQLQTSDPNVYAAGDVAQGIDFCTGEYSVHAIQPTATDHARVAASNMAGRSQAYHGSVLMNVLDTMGLVASSFGRWQGVDGGDSVELSDPERFRYLNLQFQDDRIVGASSLGLTDHVGVLRGLIQTRVRLGDWKQRLMQDPTRLMEAYLASTQPLGYNARLA